MTDDERAVITLQISGQRFTASLPVRGSIASMSKELAIALAREVEKAAPK